MPIASEFELQSSVSACCGPARASLAGVCAVCQSSAALGGTWDSLDSDAAVPQLALSSSSNHSIVTSHRAASQSCSSRVTGQKCSEPSLSTAGLSLPPPFITSDTQEMETFEDENPFDTDHDRINSEESSAFKVNLSEPSSPPPQPLRLPSSPSATASPPRPSFPSSGSHRQPQAYKSDFCCARDQWLHSGEDVEILVRCM